jgi:hypothetical protein
VCRQCQQGHWCMPPTRGLIGCINNEVRCH